MSYRRNARGLLGLLVVAVLAVMAFASSAWAILPVFLIAKKAALHATVTGVSHEGLELLIVPALNLEIKCPEFEVREGLILTSEYVDAKLLYKNCKAFSITPLEELKNCHLSDVSGGDKTKLHITASFLLLPIEFADGKFGLLAEKIAAFLNFLPEMGCPLPLKSEIKGEICFKITADNDTVKPLIESNQTIQEECPEIKLELDPTKPVTKDKLLYGVNEAFLDAKALLFLTGVHAGLTLGISLL